MSGGFFIRPQSEFNPSVPQHHPHPRAPPPPGDLGLLTDFDFSIFSVCVTQYVIHTPVTKHWPLHSNSSCKNKALAHGCVNNAHPISCGAQTKNIDFFINFIALYFLSFAWPKLLLFLFLRSSTPFAGCLKLKIKWKVRQNCFLCNEVICEVIHPLKQSTIE